MPLSRTSSRNRKACRVTCSSRLGLYRVGERGEEWFRPNVAGSIIPNSAVQAFSKPVNGAANQNVNVAIAYSIDLAGANGDAAIEQIVTDRIRESHGRLVNAIDKTLPARLRRLNKLGT
jgi:hypothetical protein